MRNASRWIGPAGLIALTACTTTPPPPKEPTRPQPTARQLRVDRAVVRAFKDYLYARYDVVIAERKPERIDPNQALEREALARESLQQVLVEAGADAERVKQKADLVDIFIRGVRAGRRYSILHTNDRVSFSLVRVREEGTPRQVQLFDEPFGYRVTVHDETLILDLPTYLNAKLGLPYQPQVATYDSGSGTVKLDLQAARVVGKTQFLPSVETLIENARAASHDRTYLQAAQSEDVQALLAFAKTSLRWRSLQNLWSLIRNRPPEEQLERFADDYAERAELRAASELRELVALRAANPELDPTQPAERVRLLELGALSAAIHGEPQGVVADLLGLAAASLEGGKPRAGPHFQAARQLSLEFVRRLRKGPPGPAADARAFAQLARATPEVLRALAQAIYKERMS